VISLEYSAVNSYGFFMVWRQAIINTNNIAILRANNNLKTKIKPEASKYKRKIERKKLTDKFLNNITLIMFAPQTL
jgi:hypothetical protein